MAEPIVDRGQGAGAITPESVAALQELAQAFLAFEQACSFYPEGHQSRTVPLGRLLDLLRAEAQADGAAGLGVVGETLLWRGALHEEPTAVQRKFAALLGAQGIAHLNWTAQLTPGELQRFVNALVRGRGVGRRTAWNETLQFEHLRIESPDYRSLMTESGETAEVGARRNLLHELLRRVLAGQTTALATEELSAFREALADPAAAAALLTAAIGTDDGGGAPTDAVEKVRRFAALVAQALPPGADGGPDATAALAAIGRNLPAGLRLELLESALGEEDGVFAGAFGALPPEDGVVVLGRNFTLDPARIEQLTRVFQLLVPRQLDRMEMAPRLREEVRRATDPDQPLAENAWEEAQELLTGEAGAFMSDAYREQLGRLAAREAARRDGEAAHADLPELTAALQPNRVAEGSLRIQFEELVLATSVDGYRTALEGLAGLCGATLAAGDRVRGLTILRRLLELRAGDEPLAGPRAEVERAVRAMVSPPVVQSLAVSGPGVAPEDAAAVRTLLALAADVSVPSLLDALVVEEDPGRCHEIAALLQGLGPGVVPAALQRLENATGAAMRALLVLLSEAGDPAAGPPLLDLLRRDDQKMRRDVLRALLAIDSAEIRRALPGLLEDPDEEIAQSVAAHLGAVGSPETVRELLRVFGGGIFSGPRSGQVQRAILVLGKMRAAEAVRPLGELVRRRTWINRRSQEELGVAAAQALARIGGAEARKALEQGAARGAGKVAAACRRSLARWAAGA
jgi:HEAT repeat protein